MGMRDQASGPAGSDRRRWRPAMTDTRIAMGVALGASVVAIASQFDTFVDPFVISEDARQHIYWMQRFRNPTLFPDDLLVRYSEHYQPWGYIGFYRLLAVLIDPLVVSRVLPVVLSAATAVVLYQLVSSVSDRFGGVLAAACFAATPEYMSRMSGAFPRGFAYGLLATSLLLLLRKRYRWLGAVLVIESLFYPVSFVVSAGTWLLCALVNKNGGFRSLRLHRPGREHWPCAIAVALSCVMLSMQFVFERDPSIGRIVTREQMADAPEYGPRGRIEILPGPLLVGEVARQVVRGVLPHQRSSLHAGGWIKLVPIAVLLGYLAIRVARGRREWPWVLLAFPVAGVAGFLLAEVLLLKLFLPARYLEATIKLSVLIACSVAVSDGVAAIRERRAAAAFAMQILVLSVPLLALPAMGGRGLQDRGEARSLAGFLATLPVDTLIAAHPYVADDIPYFAGRSVLVNQELAHPFYDAYWATVSDRTRAVLAAHYARDWSEVDAFCRAYGVDVFVVDRRYFTPSYLDGERRYFEPFDSQLRDLVAGSRDFALLAAAESKRIFETGDQFVVRCGEQSGRRP